MKQPSSIITNRDQSCERSLYKHTMILLVILSLFCNTLVKAQEAIPSLIPIPVSVEKGEGNFTLNDKTSLLVAASQDEISHIAQYFIEKAATSTGLALKVKDKAESNFISLELNKKADAEIGEEGYKLSVSAEKVIIMANKPAGLFYGIQTLLQLLPKEIESDSVVKSIEWAIPAISIKDYPRFGWRGLMLDVSRHFFPKEVVKEFIDEMARYKYNVFHWHLADDQGWRLEIKSLPKLTEVGAWRVPRHGKWGTNEPPKPGEKATDGGFYTQEDVKEIIQYAKDRYIEILPEIDVPGHSMAAIASYPYLSSTQDTTTKVNPGSKFSTWFGNGKFAMDIDNNLDPSNEKVYEFLDKVFTEVAAMFPFEYIHAGGDEAYKGYWEKDPENQALMKKMNLKNADELQSYFSKKVNKIIQSKGKKMIGWDEILEGGLAPGAAVMSWRGPKGGVEASHLKAPVVMAPAPVAYLDLYQGDPAVEPPTYSMARLKDTYTYDPIAEGIDAKYVLGGQGNIWTEQIPTKPAMEYMAYPRALALSEVYWSPKNKRDWSGFVDRVEGQFKRLDEAQMNYSESMYDPIIKVTQNKEGQLVINMTTEVEGVQLYFTLDHTLPSRYNLQYTTPIQVPEDADLFRVQSYRNGHQIGKLITIPVEDLKKRIKK